MGPMAKAKRLANSRVTLSPNPFPHGKPQSIGPVDSRRSLVNSVLFEHVARASSHVSGQSFIHGESSRRKCLLRQTKVGIQQHRKFLQLHMVYTNERAFVLAPVATFYADQAIVWALEALENLMGFAERAQQWRARFHHGSVREVSHAGGGGRLGLVSSIVLSMADTYLGLSLVLGLNSSSM